MTPAAAGRRKQGWQHRLGDHLRAMAPAWTQALLVALAILLGRPTGRSMAVATALGVVAALLLANGLGLRRSRAFPQGLRRWLRHPEALALGILGGAVVLAARSGPLAIGAVPGLMLFYGAWARRWEQRAAKIMGPVFKRFQVAVPAFLPTLVPAVPATMEPVLQRAIDRGGDERRATLRVAGETVIGGLGLLLVQRLGPDHWSHWLIAGSVTLCLFGWLIYDGVGARQAS